ncbi:MAG: hypothetical protein DMF64_18435 [Acidobacteria bacterium]|nr:MAG: hypothetical protein DMF64_18435 [Acidobacteriota bacterium]
MSAHAENEIEPMTQRSSTRDTDTIGAHDERAWLLYRGIKNLLRCDEAEVVTGIARYVMSQHASLRRGAALMTRTRETPLPSVVALLGGVTRLLEVRADERRDGAVWVARLSNERRAIEPLLALLPELGWTELKFRRRPDVVSLAALARSLGSARRILKLARRLHRRHEFFKVLRVIELIGYYARYLDLFQRGRFRLAVMSSHSNPHGIAFNLAARKCGVPVVLITHGMPVRPVARLSYDLAVVHCEAARQTYLNEGCRIERGLIHGRRQHHAPMPTGPLPEHLRVGIFLCKDVNEQRLRAVVERLLADARVARILVRPHPKNLWLGLDEWTLTRNDPRLRRNSGGSVYRDLEETDIVLAGNSSVLVDAVARGRPAAYVPGLDYGSLDLHQFVARGLIYPIDEELSFDPDALLRFYQRPDWPDVLRLFANVDEDEASVAAQAAAAMRELALAQGTGAMASARRCARQD